MIAQQYISTSFSSQQSYRPFELLQTRPTPAESLPDRGTVHEIMQNIWALDWTSTPAWDTHTMGCVFFTCVYVRACLCMCGGPWLTGCWHILITLGSCCFWPWVAGCGSSTSHILTIFYYQQLMECLIMTVSLKKPFFYQSRKWLSFKVV